MSKGKETDTQLSRRKALQAAGITAGAFLLGRFTSLAADPSPVAGDESSPVEWKPVTLNPQEVAASAYEYYPQGGCMYASFKAICISMARATAHTNPPLSKAIFQFPFLFAQYGRGLVYGMDGCDPDGVVEECGGGWYLGSATPGYRMGMLRIPQTCCTPEGVQWEEAYALRAWRQMGTEPFHTNNPFHTHLFFCANLRNLRLKKAAFSLLQICSLP